MMGICSATQVIAEAVIARLPEFSTQGIGNVVWGFSAVGHYHKDMYSLIAREIPPHLSQFLPQELSNVLLGFARFGHLDPGLLKVRRTNTVTKPGIANDGFAASSCPRSWGRVRLGFTEVRRASRPQLGQAATPNCCHFSGDMSLGRWPSLNTRPSPIFVSDPHACAAATVTACLVPFAVFATCPTQSQHGVRLDYQHSMLLHMELVNLSFSALIVLLTYHIARAGCKACGAGNLTSDP